MGRGSIHAVRLRRWRPSSFSICQSPTRPIATQLCDAGRVQVNGRDAKPSTKVRVGDRVKAYRRARAGWSGRATCTLPAVSVALSGQSTWVSHRSRRRCHEDAARLGVRTTGRRSSSALASRSSYGCRRGSAGVVRASDASEHGPEPHAVARIGLCARDPDQAQVGAVRVDQRQVAPARVIRVTLDAA